MPRIDFSKIDDIQDFSPLPAGQYLCRLVEVKLASTISGDEMWKIRFTVESGEYSGRCIFDNLVFSPAAMKRVKLICSRLGLDTSRELVLEPSSIIGRTAYVSVEIEEYEDQEGNTKKRNVVPFAGYDRVDGHTATTRESGKDDEAEKLPF
jgi:hypothetical protein